MKTILIVLTLSLLASCAMPTMNQSKAHDLTIIGDSMAAGVNLFNYEGIPDAWAITLSNDIDNRGISGATMQTVMASEIIEGEQLNTVIVFMSFNNIKNPAYSVNDIIDMYTHALRKLQASTIICVGVPHIESAKFAAWWPEGLWLDNARIDAVNEGIRKLATIYIDTSDVATVDGVHPEYGKIVERIKGEMNE